MNEQWLLSGDGDNDVSVAARDVLYARCPPAVTRECYDDPERWRSLWKTVVDLGWPVLASGDEAGGLGTRELVGVLEECGAATLPAPLLSSVGHAAGVLRAASATDLLDELADGAIGTLLATPLGGRLPDATLVLADGRLTGRASSVADAVRADLLVALATDESGSSLAVAFRAATVTIEPNESVDPSRPLATVTVDTVPEFLAPISVSDAFAPVLLASAAELIGVARQALALTVEHARTRRQFGQPIGAFQSVKHRIADCYVALERARSLTYAAAEQSARGDGNWFACALAKAAAADAATSATRVGVGVHGAIAQSWEHDMNLLLRRAWVGCAVAGETRALYAAAAREYAKASA